MNPRRGEKPPLISSSRSQSWRAVRSHEGQSFECAFISAARAAGTCNWTSSPPCGAIRWLVKVVKFLILPIFTSILRLVSKSVELIPRSFLYPGSLGGERTVQEADTL